MVKVLLSENGHVAYQIKRNHRCSNIAANILPVYSHPCPRPWGSKGQISTFSEHGHVACQIKRNHECSNIVANILLAEPPSPPPPLGIKIHPFQNMVTLHIKLKGIKYAATLSKTFHLQIPPTRPALGVKRSKFNFFQNSSGCIKGNRALSTMQAHFFSLHTPSTCGLN